MNLSPEVKLAAAIVRVADKEKGEAPYFGPVLRGLIRRKTTEVKTLAVSKFGVLYWSPEFVNRTPVEVLSQGLMHETMHVLLKHHERAAAVGATTPALSEIANWAEDACINEELSKIRPMPDWVITPAKLQQKDGLIFEERYRLLKDSVKYVTISFKGVGSGECGSCSGNKAPCEPAEEDRDSRSKAEMDRYVKETANAIKEHAAKKPGSVPGGLMVWADAELETPRVDWRQKLSKTVRGTIAHRIGAVDYTWRKPSRRQAGYGYGPGKPIMPAFYAPQPRVGFLADVSGSMMWAMKRVASELQGVFTAVQAKLTVCTVDAQVQGVKECASIQQAIELFKGGGGTYLTPGFEALSKRRPPPEVVVVLTDGEIGDGYPETPPSYRVVWCVVGDTEFEPTYGEVVRIEERDLKENP